MKSKDISFQQSFHFGLQPINFQKSKEEILVLDS